MIVCLVRHRSAPFIFRIFSRDLHCNMAEPSVGFGSVPMLYLRWNRNYHPRFQADCVLSLLLVPSASRCADTLIVKQKSMCIQYLYCILPHAFKAFSFPVFPAFPGFPCHFPLFQPKYFQQKRKQNSLTAGSVSSNFIRYSNNHFFPDNHSTILRCAFSL